MARLPMVFCEKERVRSMAFTKMQLENCELGDFERGGGTGVW